MNQSDSLSRRVGSCGRLSINADMWFTGPRLCLALFTIIPHNPQYLITFTHLSQPPLTNPMLIRLCGLLTLGFINACDINGLCYCVRIPPGGASPFLIRHCLRGMRRLTDTPNTPANSGQNCRTTRATPSIILALISRATAFHTAQIRPNINTSTKMK